MHYLGGGGGGGGGGGAKAMLAPSLKLLGGGLAPPPAPPPFSYAYAFCWLNDVTNLRHNAFAMSASLDKTAFAFHFFDTLYILKSCNDA